MEDDLSVITHTIVPPSMRSHFWRYFGFPCNKYNKIITRDKVICILCNATLSYNKNTSNLRTHLVARHPKRMLEFPSVEDAVDPPLLQVANNGADGCDGPAPKAVKRCFDNNAHSKLVTETVPISGSLVDETVESELSTDNTEPEDNEEDNLPDIATILITNLNPISTVKDSGIRDCFKHKHFVDKALTNLGRWYEPMRNTISQFLLWQTQRAPFALGIEYTRNLEQLVIVSVYVHFVDTRCACDVDGSSEIALGSNPDLTDEPHQLLSLLHRSCVFDELPLTAVCQGLDLTHCAAIVSSTRQADVMQFASQHGIPLIECFESVLTRCLERVFQLPKIQIDFALILKSNAEMLYTSEVQFHPTCVWSKLDWLQYVIDKSMPSNGDASLYEAWHNMQRLITYIKPLKITLDTLAEQTLSLSTVVRPLTLRLLQEHFAMPNVARCTDQLDLYLIEVHKIIIQELRNSILANTWLCEATLMDLRFQHDYIDSDILERTALEQMICKRFKVVVDGSQDNVTTNNEIRSQKAKMDEHNEVSVLERTSSLKKFLMPRRAEAKEHAVLTQSKLEMELARYRFEPKLDLDQCPLRWWRQNTHYRQLHDVAEYYLCVPSCVNRLFRLDTEARFGWRRKRYQLRQFCKMEKYFWYMHYNHTFYENLRCRQTKGEEDIGS